MMRSVDCHEKSQAKRKVLVPSAMKPEFLKSVVEAATSETPEL